MSRITLTTPYGDFSGNSLADVTKKAEQAKRHIASPEKIRVEHQKLARLNSYYAAYLVLSPIVGNTANELTVFKEGSGWFPKSRQSDGYVHYRLDTLNGATEIDCFRGIFNQDRDVYLTGALLNDTGFCLGVWLKAGEQETFHAVGVHKSESSLVRLPGVAIDRYPEGK